MDAHTRDPSDGDLRLWWFQLSAADRASAMMGTLLLQTTLVFDGSTVPIYRSKFNLSLRIELCIERFADRYAAFPRSRSTVNRRVQEAAKQAGLTGRISPHCLRATAASHHAYKGVAPVPLQALMGWSDLATAQKHIRISGTATADALRRLHHR